MSIDLNMGYYHILLIKNASNICAIILLWGKYCYKNLPMRVTNSQYIFQPKMNDLFHGFKFIRAYIYECTYHLKKIKLTIHKLKEKGLKLNIQKSFFVQIEIEYLGFEVTRDGVKPIYRKISNK